MSENTTPSAPASKPLPSATARDEAGLQASPSALQPSASSSFTALPAARDWNEEWKELQKRRRHVDDASYWDKRSATFSTKDTPNPYVERFLQLAGILPGETVFDMGCGTGALSIPLGKAGHTVMAADFSTGMLDVMKQELDAQKITTVQPLHMSWEDDWATRGVKPDSADVCLASRSMSVPDMEEALLRLTDVARRRVCITLATASSPHIDENVLHDLGLQNTLGRDHLYAFNILAAHGINAEVAYIENARKDTFASFEEAYESFAHMIEHAILPATEKERADALRRLRPWLEENLVANEHAGRLDRKGIPEGAWRMRKSRHFTWAFVAWNK